MESVFNYLPFVIIGVAAFFLLRRGHGGCCGGNSSKDHQKTENTKDAKRSCH